MVNFGFFQLIKKCAESTLIIDGKNLSQEASYTAQQSSRKINLQKLKKKIV